MGWRFPVTLVALGALVACERPSTQGVRVVSAQAWGAAYAAGIRAGDVVSGWRSAEVGGPIRSPLDIEVVATERSPRGDVELTYARDGAESSARIVHGDWAMTTASHEDDASDHALAWRTVQRAAAHVKAGELEPAREAFARARAALEEPGLVTLVRARELLAFDQHESADREETSVRYAELVEGLRAGSPDSPTLAFYLVRLAVARYRLFDERSGDSYAEALAIYESFSNAEVERSLVMNHQANALLRQGAHEEAESLYLDAYETRAAVQPYAPRTASLLGNAGLALRRQGRLDEAERIVLEALDIHLEVEPRDAMTGYVLRNLGLLALDKGDYNAAEGYYERALSIFEQARPGKVEVAGMVLNLGNVAKNRGNFATAERRYRRALELRRELGVGPVELASGLHNLGGMLGELDRSDEAVSLLEEALDLKQEHVPDTPLLATTLYELGRQLYLRGELERSWELHQRALLIRRSVLGDTIDTAESLFALARIEQDRGRMDEAYATRLEAVAILEALRGRLAFGAGERSRFSARFHEEYRALTEFLVDEGRLEEAFEFLESSRGRSLRALMSQRVVSRRAVAELTSERNRLENRLARTRSRLSRIAADDDDAFRKSQEQLRDIQGRLDELSAEMARAVPALAAADSLSRFSLDSVRASLPSDAKLLSYSVGIDRTLVFVVSPTGSSEPALRVHAIDAGRERIAGEVDRLRAFIERGRIVSELEVPLLRLAHDLYRTVWSPVAADLEDVSRVFIVAEGPLLDLPFGALVSRLEPPRFLAEATATSFQTSAAAFSEFDELARSRGDSELELVAFGDPDTAGDAASLPHARDEVSRIGSLFDDSASAFVGPLANEARAKDLLPRARFVHIAAHGVLDETFPLSSRLLLSPSAAEDETRTSEDGRLHAWEVVEQLNLSAELVVLSGCETGSGREVSGEGAMGLARAFRIAGAGAVLGSLWKVSDRSTADLMVHFYGRIRSGDRSDTALAAARRELIAADMWRHPYHWAAFRLFGAVARPGD